MEYFNFMKCFESFYYLDKYFPNQVFLNVLLLFLMLGDFLKEISIVRVLHDNTKG